MTMKEGALGDFLHPGRAYVGRSRSRGARWGLVHADLVCPRCSSMRSAPSEHVSRSNTAREETHGGSIGGWTTTNLSGRIVDACGMSCSWLVSHCEKEVDAR